MINKWIMRLLLVVLLIGVIHFSIGIGKWAMNEFHVYGVDQVTESEVFK